MDPELSAHRNLSPAELGQAAEIHRRLGMPALERAGVEVKIPPSAEPSEPSRLTPEQMRDHRTAEDTQERLAREQPLG